jgi:uncharacterized protein YbcI
MTERPVSCSTSCPNAPASPFCVMKGGLTTVERTLLEAKDEPLVRHVRPRFQEAVRPQFIEVVEQVTGRRVLTYQSQIMFDPDYVVEMFVLSPR